MNKDFPVSSQGLIDTLNCTCPKKTSQYPSQICLINRQQTPSIQLFILQNWCGHWDISHIPHLISQQFQTILEIQPHLITFPSANPNNSIRMLSHSQPQSLKCFQFLSIYLLIFYFLETGSHSVLRTNLGLTEQPWMLFNSLQFFHLNLPSIGITSRSHDD